MRCLKYAVCHSSIAHLACCHWGHKVVACVTVNDAFVAQAWAESANAVGKASLPYACNP